jgi:hypothetical protein
VQAENTTCTDVERLQGAVSRIVVRQIEQQESGDSRSSGHEREREIERVEFTPDRATATIINTDDPATGRTCWFDPSGRLVRAVTTAQRHGNEVATLEYKGAVTTIRTTPTKWVITITRNAEQQIVRYEQRGPHGLRRQVEHRYFDDRVETFEDMTSGDAICFEWREFDLHWNELRFRSCGVESISSYEFDAHGNWISRTKSWVGEGVRSAHEVVTLRSISYSEP